MTSSPTTTSSPHPEKPQEVHQGLASRACWIRNYVPYQRSAEALRQEVTVLELRLGLLKDEARRLGGHEEEDLGHTRRVP